MQRNPVLRAGVVALWLLPACSGDNTMVPNLPPVPPPRVSPTSAYAWVGTASFYEIYKEPAVTTTTAVDGWIRFEQDPSAVNCDACYRAVDGGGTWRYESTTTGCHTTAPVAVMRLRNFLSGTGFSSNFLTIHPDTTYTGNVNVVGDSVGVQSTCRDDQGTVTATHLCLPEALLFQVIDPLRVGNGDRMRGTTRQIHGVYGGFREWRWDFRGLTRCTPPGSARIVMPAKNDTLVWDEYGDGNLAGVAQATASANVNQSTMEWTFPDFEGSTLVTQPTSRSGSRVQYTYQKMPLHNRDFGPREILLTGECTGLVTQPVTVFFARDGLGNPDSAMHQKPNWFYYWMQTSAGQGLTDAKEVCYVDAQQCNAARATLFSLFGFQEQLNGIFMGLFNPQAGNYVVVCDPARATSTNKVTGVATEGIDNFAVTVIHEWAHKQYYDQWWRFLREASASWQDFLTSKANLDKDNDFVPDAKEPALGLDPTKRETHPGIADYEYPAWKAEAIWTVGSADKQDWAKPGKQSND